VHHLPTYEGDEEAFEILQIHGSLEKAVTHYLNRDPRSPVQLGDVVLLDVLGQHTLGVYIEGEKAVTVVEDGSLRVLSSRFIEKGWPVWV